MTTIDVSNLSAAEVTEVMTKCTERLEVLRQEAREQAELLGMVCGLPDAKQRKPRRNSAKQHSAD
jgi:hypothetical protein